MREEHESDSFGRQSGKHEPVCLVHGRVVKTSFQNHYQQNKNDY